MDAKPPDVDKILSLHEKLSKSRKEGDAKPKPYPLRWFTELGALVDKPTLIRKLLLPNSLVVLYGESNCGKTFVALDIALAVAQGIPWRGLQCQRGLVLYVAGEGASSVCMRVAAYRKQRPDLASADFAVIPEAVDFMDLVSIDKLLQTIQAAEQECGEKTALIIIDTLARAMPNGDENSTADMGTVVSFADRLRLITEACVLFVHHCGKDPSKGARGSSALRAASDTEILVEGTAGPRSVTVTKQRDLAPLPPMQFELTQVYLGDDSSGEPVNSCVINHLGDVEPEMDRSSNVQLRGKAQRQMLAALRQKGTAVYTLADLRKFGREIGLSKTTAQSAVDSLAASPYFVASVGGYLFTDGKASELTEVRTK